MSTNNAPDKIYLHPDIGGREFIRPWLHNAANYESVCYIRKDALLEWARNELTARRESGNDYFQPGIVVLTELIDKLNSL